jgi:DNA-binding response OmpR family regulator
MGDIQPARLLVVDDDESLQVLLLAIFRRQGMDVDVADSHAAALQRLRQKHYDAMILEVILRARDGREMLHDLAEDRSHILSRTIVLTTADDRTLASIGVWKLVHRLMRKPFELEDLIDAVHGCLTAPADRGSVDGARLSREVRGE